MKNSKRKVKFIHRGENNIHIHNDLQNAAFYFKNIIESKNKEKDAGGKGFDCMACMTMLAFSLEAILNFFGEKCIKKWKEKEKEWLSFDGKIEEVFDALGIKLDSSKRPHSAVKILRKFRNIVAHGKPITKKFEKVMLMDPDKADRINSLEGKWEKYCQSHLVLQVYEDMDIIWKELFERSGLRPFDTITQGGSSLSVVPDEAVQPK